MSPFTDIMIILMEESESYKKLLELNWVWQVTRPTHTKQLNFYILAMNNWKLILKNATYKIKSQVQIQYSVLDCFSALLYKGI